MLKWPYTQSPWDGDLRRELRTWGYLDDDYVHSQADYFCDFDDHHHVKRAFDEMGIDARSAGQGGPNHCFKLQHADSPAVLPNEQGNKPTLPSEQRYMVDGRVYSMTNAFSRIGINRASGILYFIHRKSPEKAAADLWDIPQPQVNADDLPKLRTSSDLAWGLWNRVPGGGKINKIMALEIVNEDTAAVIIPRALATAKEPADEVLPWPGTDVVVGSEEEDEAEAALALIGSPNGLGAAYFLLQHKRQLGGPNFIYKIRIFKGDDEWESEDPHLLFYVDGHAPLLPDDDDMDWSPGAGGSGPVKGRAEGVGVEMGGEEGKGVETKILDLSRDGKSVVRQHVVWF
ncbi:hypothetical protein BDW02DRAFT_494450 [Decorospora gaudefroyi]|uniref:Uncharacterized protein n=1 Tax=Decorospora gaudefroyi TaxID=184978 RepID=A0A6A5KKC2_9PLEO|nr:hypothetical protein BDW02DRAFT_494450 [Decorospora gaudefroyi]